MNHLPASFIIRAFGTKSLLDSMEIILNGESRNVAEACSITLLTEQLNLAGKRYAVEVNEDIIPRSRHSAYVLSPGDKVEIVHAIGGG